MSSRRLYRRSLTGFRLRSFSVQVKESDLWVAVSSHSFSAALPGQVEKLILNYRSRIETYLEEDPLFAAALEPCLVPPGAPEIIRKMVYAGNKAGVGPMAAVAGAIAEEVGFFLADKSPEVIVENGGDIFIKLLESARLGIYAGSSPLSGKIALKIEPGQTPLGVCTSSGTVGPSLSFGCADAAVVLSPSAPLADAVATALGNRVKSRADLEGALNYARDLDEVTGALLIVEDKIAAWGAIELE